MWIPHVSVSSPGCGSASGRRMDSYRKGMCIFCNLASIGQPHPLSHNGQLKFYNDEVIRPWQPFHNSGLQQLLDRCPKATPQAMPQAIFRKFRNFSKIAPGFALRLRPRANKNLHIPSGYASG
ncbi:hypothetical protein T05_4645, partial [Trichinella murrelli]